MHAKLLYHNFMILLFDQFCWRYALCSWKRIETNFLWFV